MVNPVSYTHLGEDFSSVTAQYLLKKMKEDKKVVAFTSATPTVMGFTEDKRKEALSLSSKMVR